MIENFVLYLIGFINGVISSLGYIYLIEKRTEKLIEAMELKRDMERNNHGSKTDCKR